MRRERATGVVGLIRLRTWGLLVALVANLLVGLPALTGALPVGSCLRAVGAPVVIVALATVSAYAGFGHRATSLISLSERGEP